MLKSRTVTRRRRKEENPFAELGLDRGGRPERGMGLVEFFFSLGCLFGASIQARSTEDYNQIEN